MQKRFGAILTLGLAAALVAGTGCVTKKTFRQNVSDTDERVTSVEDAVESTSRKIDDLGRETDDKIANLDNKAQQAMQVGNSAMSKAEQAAKAAQGKLLWDVTLSNDNVKFDFGRAQLSQTATTTLDDLVNKVKSYSKALYIEVEGHTDATGEENLNEKLGLMRADAVRVYLNERGIPLHAINTISYGESKPVADNGSQDGRAKNRRVVIRVLE